jgi:serine/threonine protein kinase/HEAT repeat protein
MTRTPPCPDSDTYRQLARGEAPAEQRDNLLEHLKSCQPCRERVAAFPQGAALLRQVATTRFLRTTPGGGKGGLTEKDLREILSPPETAEELGRLGPYRVLKILGHGGMGVVFGAEDVLLQRPVALKTMLPSLVTNTTARERFLREARATAAIRHDHIVAIYQVGEHRNIPYLAMEFLEGESLDERLRRQGKLLLAETLRIGRETALALAAAHQRGLIHRDIKPANLWLESRDQGSGVRGQGTEGSASSSLIPDPWPLTPARVKLLDFGLAHIADGDVRLSQPGIVVGTPAYIAPEQALGQTIDGRSDLFSLGCVLYHLATGQLPFLAATPVATLMAVTSTVPPAPRALDPDLPDSFSQLVMQLLAKDPNDRPASALAVAQALAVIEQEISNPAPAGDHSADVPAAPLAPAYRASLPARRRGVPRPPQALAEQALFTFAPLELLEAAESAEEPVELCVEGEPWLGPHVLLYQAKLCQRAMPILFAVARQHGAHVGHWGLLTAVELEKTATRLLFGHVERLVPPISPQGILTRLSGKPWDTDLRRPFYLCKTLAFLKDLAPGSGAASSVTMPEPQWPAVPPGSWLDQLRAVPAHATGGGDWRISGRDLVSHLLVRHSQGKAVGAPAKSNLNLDLVIHAIQNPDALSAVPALLKIVKGKEVFYQRVAVECLSHVGPAEVAAVDFLVEKLKDPHPEVRSQVMACLLQIGPTTQASLPLLIDALRDDAEEIRAWAVRSLRRIGPPAAAAVDGLLRMVKGSSVAMRLRVITALAVIGGDAGTVVPWLCRALAHADAQVRALAARALAGYGAAAAEAVPVLLELSTKDPDAIVRTVAAAALQHLEAAVAAADRLLSFPCPHCHAPLRVAAKRAGRSASCPSCAQTVVVPSEGESSR